jgi:hypothetical protein
MEDLKQEILNCPFCNKDAIVELYSDYYKRTSWRGHCMVCGALGRKADTRELALLYWNRRAPSAALLSLQERYNAQAIELEKATKAALFFSQFASKEMTSEDAKWANEVVAHMAKE